MKRKIQLEVKGEIPYISKKFLERYQVSDYHYGYGTLEYTGTPEECEEFIQELTQSNCLKIIGIQHTDL
tara:strand:+ start:1054 stop:1260 length:207 start_codon:yes stop_codon:yes gene_type:complete